MHTLMERCQSEGLPLTGRFGALLKDTSAVPKTGTLQWPVHTQYLVHAWTWTGNPPVPKPSPYAPSSWGFGALLKDTSAVPKTAKLASLQRPVHTWYLVHVGTLTGNPPVPKSLWTELLPPPVMQQDCLTLIFVFFFFFNSTKLQLSATPC